MSPQASWSGSAEELGNLRWCCQRLVEASLGPKNSNVSLWGPKAASERQFPVLPNEVVTEAVMLFFLYELEAVLFVDVSGGVENAVGP